MATRATDKLKFLIQEFRSGGRTDRARYYLRLEKDGALKGWTVPKGLPGRRGF